MNGTHSTYQSGCFYPLFSLLNFGILTFYCDNSAVVHIINKHSSKDSNLMKLMRRFMVNVLKYNIVFKAQHVPGLSNIPADLISRLHIKQFHEKFPLP